METKELIDSGLDTVNTFIKYLAKDAVSSDFMSGYATSRNIQKQATDNQNKILNDLIDSSRKQKILIKIQLICL